MASTRHLKLASTRTKNHHRKPHGRAVFLLRCVWFLSLASCVTAPRSTFQDECTGDKPCVYSEEFDCDSKDFFRGPWTFTNGEAFGECYAPPGVLPQPKEGACETDSDCAHGAYCVGQFCTTVHNYFCAEQVAEPTAFGCNAGESPQCNEDGLTCLDQWFECLPDTDGMRKPWPTLGDQCEDIILTYEIVAEVIDTAAASNFCSKRHEGCDQAEDCTAPSRPAADHCGPEEPPFNTNSREYDCLAGDNPTPACPDSSAPDWPEGLGAEMDLTFIERAERKVSAVCEASGCGAAVCRPDDGTLGYTDGGLGIQGSSGIKDDSFIGHARVCASEGLESCNDTSRPEATTGTEPCQGGTEVDESRDTLVPGGVSRREVDIRCQCTGGTAQPRD